MQGLEAAAHTFTYPADRQQIQEIQDSLADCLGIVLFVTDRSGAFITRPSGPASRHFSEPEGRYPVARMAVETGLLDREEEVLYVSCDGVRHILAPIRLDGSLVGIMVGVEPEGSAWERDGKPSDLDLKLLSPGQVSLGPLDRRQALATGKLLGAIANRLVELDVRSQLADWRVHELAVINEASVAMTSTLDLRALPDIVVKKAAELALAEVAFLVMPDERTGDLRLAAAFGLPETAKQRMRIPLGDGPIGKAALTGEPVLAIDTALPVSGEERKSPPKTQRSSMICIPLKAGGNMAGVLGVWRSGIAYGRESIQTLQSLATHATFAILNARLYDEAQQSLQKLNRLFELGTEISSRQNVDEVLEQVNRHALEATHGVASNITLIDDEGHVKVRSAMGFPARVNKRVIVRPDGLSMQVKRSGQPLAIPDNLTTTYVVNPAILHTGFKSSLCLPLKAKDKTIGVMWMHYSEPRTFPQSDINLLVAFANQAAVAIDNAQLRDELVHRATRDGKTGLFNHDFFLSRLRAEMGRSRLVEGPLSLIMIDVDCFKEYNDTFGHLAGDEALRLVSSSILEKTRKTDVVARYGGEEFAVLLPNTGAEAALFIAERIRSAVEAASFRIVPSPAQPCLTISLGIASFPQQAGTENELIERADRALYSAKAQGKNKVSVFSP